MRNFFSLLIAVIFSAPAFSQSEAEMKAWNDYMTPGEVHEMMARSVGKWKSTMQMWHAPGTDPMTMEAEYNAEMILGGRYLRENHTGNFMGMPFEGQAIFGYDNAKKLFVCTWIDNMGTGIMFMEGQWNNELNAVELHGRSTDPMSGKDMKVRQVFRFIDDNTSEMEMYMTHEGKEFKSMHSRSTRM